MKIAVFGASGYVGLELLRWLRGHPEAEIALVTSEQRAGQPLGEAFPGLRGWLDLRFEAADPERQAEGIDLAFTALPHAASAPTVATLRKAGVPVADLSADFRFDDLATYEAAYDAHPAPELLPGAVYGLPELNRQALRDAQLVACPGCYPTGALLPLAPFLREGLVETSGIVVDAKSGVSGAGRKAETGFLFAELDGNAAAYKVAAHRHGPEIEEQASGLAGEPVQVTFVPQLIPTTRGLLSSVYCRPKAGLGAAAARSLLAESYADEPFVRVLPEGETPSLSAVRGTNFCDVAAFSDERSGTLVLLSAIDNLGKGASGQAVQCANLMQGLPETQGLLGSPLLP